MMNVQEVVPFTNILEQPAGSNFDTTFMQFENTSWFDDLQQQSTPQVSSMNPQLDDSKEAPAGTLQGSSSELDLQSMLESLKPILDGEPLFSMQQQPQLSSDFASKNTEYLTNHDSEALFSMQQPQSSSGFAGNTTHEAILTENLPPPSFDDPSVLKDNLDKVLAAASSYVMGSSIQAKDFVHKVIIDVDDYETSATTSISHLSQATKHTRSTDLSVDQPGEVNGRHKQQKAMDSLVDDDSDNIEYTDPEALKLAKRREKNRESARNSRKRKLEESIEQATKIDQLFNIQSKFQKEIYDFMANVQKRLSDIENRMDKEHYENSKTRDKVNEEFATKKALNEVKEDLSTLNTIVFGQQSIIKGLHGRVDTSSANRIGAPNYMVQNSVQSLHPAAGGSSSSSTPGQIHLNMGNDRRTNWSSSTTTDHVQNNNGWGGMQMAPSMGVHTFNHNSVFPTNLDPRFLPHY
ncbi:hypothetical protein Tsubulata_032714 [Turnera subulata]|uniref:BZIP domain-containing protein n=1 Tax=Turnera subulata TaxID=218843 RepID=A0A9Q0J5V9_9ROSI|nr:hypothetical protein Tsubulata_032714 [Turnera subulata]